MIAVYIIGGILLLLLILLLLPVGAEAAYDEEGFRLWLRPGPVRVKLIPREEKPGSEEKKKRKQAEKTRKKEKKKKESESPEKKKKGGGLKEILELIPAFREALGSLLGKIVIRRLKLWLIIGAPDPAKAAMTFGGVSAGEGLLVPLLQSCFRIKKMDLRNSVDFTAEQTAVILHADLRIRPLWAVAIALRLLRRYLTIHKQYAPDPPHKGPERGKDPGPAEKESGKEPGEKKKLTARQIAERKKKYGKASDR